MLAAAVVVNMLAPPAILAVRFNCSRATLLHLFDQCGNCRIDKLSRSIRLASCVGKTMCASPPIFAVDRTEPGRCTNPTACVTCSPSAATDISPMRIDAMARGSAFFTNRCSLLASSAAGQQFRNRDIDRASGTNSSVQFTGTASISNRVRAKMTWSLDDGLSHQGKLQQTLGKVAAEPRWRGQ